MHYKERNRGKIMTKLLMFIFGGAALGIITIMTFLSLIGMYVMSFFIDYESLSK